MKHNDTDKLEVRIPKDAVAKFTKKLKEFKTEINVKLKHISKEGNIEELNENFEYLTSLIEGIPSGQVKNMAKDIFLKIKKKISDATEEIQKICESIFNDSEEHLESR